MTSISANVRQMRAIGCLIREASHLVAMRVTSRLLKSEVCRSSDEWNKTSNSNEGNIIPYIKTVD